MSADAADESDGYTFEWLLVREVFEESYLREVPAGGIDLLPSGPRPHGPWDPARCSEVLLRWLALGLIEVDERSVGAPQPWLARAHDDAVRVLKDHSHWDEERYRSTAVCPSDALLREPDPETVLWAAASGAEGVA